MQIKFSKDNTIQSKSDIYYNTPSDWARSHLFYVEMGGYFVCDNQYLIDRRGFDSYLLFFTVKGSGTIETPLGTSRCGEGEVSLINCNDPHIYYANDYWEFMWFHFNGNHSRQIVEMVLSRQINNVRIPETSLSLRYFELITKKHIGKSINEEIMVSAYVQYILAEMIAYSGNTVKLQRTNRINEAIAYIEQHYPENIVIDDIANALNISRSSFSHEFKRETGFSPYEFITNKRINRSKELLKMTEMSVGDIANTVGFNSQANFIKIFRERNGMTPNAFRKSRNNTSTFIDVYFGKRLYDTERLSPKN